MADFVRVFQNAEIDAVSLSSFMSAASGAKVNRRLAPPIDTLEYFLAYLRGIEQVYVQPTGSVTVGSTTIRTVGQIIADADSLATIEVAKSATAIANATSAANDATNAANAARADAAGVMVEIKADAVIATNDAINNTAVEGGVLADTFVTATTSIAGTVARTQRDKNNEPLSLKDSGAVGDGVADDSVAIRKAFMSGRKIAVNEGVYLMKTPIDADTYTFFDIANYTEIVGTGNARIVMDNPTKGVKTPYACRVVAKKGIKIKGVKFQGHITEGVKPNSQRVWGLGFYGCVDLDISENNEFSTFEGHNLHINRDYSIKDWIKLGNKNSAASVQALLATSSRNVKVNSNKFRHGGSSCFAMFGVHGGNVSDNDVDVTGSLFPMAIWTDDASSGTALVDYAVNHDVKITNNRTNGVIAATGLSKGTISGNTAKAVNYTSYDFNQQINNFGSTETTPFLWMNYLDGVVDVFGNDANESVIEGSSSVIYRGNTFTSSAPDKTLLSMSGNGVRWTDNVNYSDAREGAVGLLLLDTNTFVARHSGITGINYGVNASLHYKAKDSMFISDGGTFAKYEVEPSSLRNLSSRYIADASNKLNMKKEVNFPYEFKKTVSVDGTLNVNGIATLSKGVISKSRYTDSSLTQGSFIKDISNANTSGTIVQLLEIDTSRAKSQSASIFTRFNGNRSFSGNGLTIEYDLEIFFDANGAVSGGVVATKRPYGGTTTLSFSIVEVLGATTTLQITLNTTFCKAVAEINYSGLNLPVKLL